MIMDSDAVWAAIENVAREYDMSCSRLARISGLDATTFNKSKRKTTTGKPHWPSVETLVKVMSALNISWAEFERYFPAKK